MSKHYLVVGAGRSGIAAAGLLLGENAAVTLYDGNEALDTAGVQEKIGGRVDFILGSEDKIDCSLFDECVVSPGVSINSPVVKKLISGGVHVIGEIELAFERDRGDVLAITGTNGKTTTTSLVYEIMKRVNEHTMVVGNIEIPYTGCVSSSVPGGVTVAEISSFQLETTTEFHPRVSAILNITDDHLDRHGSMEEYIRLKKHITDKQDENDFCVLNYEDEILRELAGSIRARVMFFSSRRRLSNGIYLDGEDICLSRDGNSHTLFKSGDVSLVGTHNLENVMAAAAICLCAGADENSVYQGVKAFKAVEHRIEFTAQIDGVKYYNDSKGTNPDAAVKAVEAMPGKTLLIAGGYDKKADYSGLIESLKGKCRLLVLIGQTKNDIARACMAAGFKDFVFADSLAKAVDICAENAKGGECVLLSPACASWDMFKSYQQRGNEFKALVKKRLRQEG